MCPNSAAIMNPNASNTVPTSYSNAPIVITDTNPKASGALPISHGNAPVITTETNPGTTNVPCPHCSKLIPVAAIKSTIFITNASTNTILNSIRTIEQDLVKVILVLVWRSSLGSAGSKCHAGWACTRFLVLERNYAILRGGSSLSH